MQNLLQSVQFRCHIYNSDIEPEHDTDYTCGCAVCNYKARKLSRLNVQKTWSKAVIYPGKLYHADLVFAPLLIIIRREIVS